MVEVWDALTSDRPYRKAWSRQKTLQHIVSLSGSHFDPDVVDSFLEYDREYGLTTAGEAAGAVPAAAGGSPLTANSA